MIKKVIKLFILLTFIQKIVPAVNWKEDGLELFSLPGQYKDAVNSQNYIQALEILKTIKKNYDNNIMPEVKEIPVMEREYKEEGLDSKEKVIKKQEEIEEKIKSMPSPPPAPTPVTPVPTKTAPKTLQDKLSQYGIPLNININAPYQKSTVLIYAATRGDKEFVQLLLQAGANRTQTDNNKKDVKWWLNRLIQEPGDKTKVCGGGTCRFVDKSVFREILALV